MVAEGAGERKPMNFRNRETSITIQPSDKPVTIKITTLVKRGRQWVQLPPGAVINHKPLTPSSDSP